MLIKLKKTVPADIQGLQRIEYSDVRSLRADGLIPQIEKYLVRERTHPRNIYNQLSGNNRNKQFYFALEVLAHLRDNARLPWTTAQRLCPGSYLRNSDREQVIDKMTDLGLLGSSVHSKKGAQLTKKLFPELLKVG